MTADEQLASVLADVDDIMQAVRELRAAHERGPDWYTGGRLSGHEKMWSYIRIWTEKAQAAYARIEEIRSPAVKVAEEDPADRRG